MGRHASGRAVGDKLGPRLVDLAVAATLATRRGLAPHEARVRQAATQAIIDRAGHEVADLYAPLLADFLARDGVDPLIRDHVAKAVSGRHQWQAIAGLALGATGGASVISTILSNELAPLVYGVVRDNPHLVPDVGTVASLAAHGVIDSGDAVSAGGATGYHYGWTDALIAAAATVPDVTTLTALVNRGVMDGGQAEYWMGRAAVPADLRGPLLSLRRQLLSPAEAALGVLRGTLSYGAGVEIAAANGLDAGDFATLIANTGEPLGLEQLAEALRRGFIDEARFAEGVRQSRVRDEWIPVAEALRYSPVPTADAIDAWQRGRIGQDQAVTIARLNGVEPDQIDILLANAGNPPGPVQLLELLRRGYIDQARAEAGLRQGRTRDEWIGATLDLAYAPMSPADAIDAWQRGHIDQARADLVMAENGVLERDRPALLANAGNPLALEQLLEAFRREIITEDQLVTGIRQGRTRDDWIPAAVALRYSPMSTADAVDASVQNHLTYGQAAKIAQENGLRPEDFAALWQTAGEPLARTELQQLYNRGLITIETYLQGLRESRLKDKYLSDAVQLHIRLPEPRLVTEAVADGVITPAAAARYLADEGFAPDTAALLVKMGAVRSTGPYRQLMTSEIATLYADRMISRTEALADLAKLHWQPANADLVLDLADHTRDQKIRNSAITAIRAHYLAYRTDATNATADLLALNIPATTAALYLQVWGIERLAHPKLLTEAQLVKAAKLNLFVTQGTLTSEQWAQKNQDIGKSRLEQLGYSPEDAGLLLAGA